MKQIEKNSLYLPCSTQESAEEDDDDSDDSDDDEEIDDDDEEEEEAMEDSDGEQVWSSLFFLRQQFVKGSERRNRCSRWNIIIQIKYHNNSDDKNHITLHIDNNCIEYGDEQHQVLSGEVQPKFRLNDEVVNILNPSLPQINEACCIAYPFKLFCMWTKSHFEIKGYKLNSPWERGVTDNEKCLDSFDSWNPKGQSKV